MNLDKDLQSVQEARDLARKAKEAQQEFQFFTQGQVDKIIKAIKAVHPYEQAAIDLYPLAISPHDIARK